MNPISVAVASFLGAAVGLTAGYVFFLVQSPFGFGVAEWLTNPFHREWQIDAAIWTAIGLLSANALLYFANKNSN